MIDGLAVSAFANGLGLGLFVLTMAWATLWIVHFVKTVLSGVAP